MIAFAPTTLQNAVSANANGNVLSVAAYQSIAIQVVGTFTATVNFEGSIDGATWAAVAFFNSSGANASSASAPGLFTTYNVGYTQFRARVAWTSGTSVSVYAAGNG